MGGKPSNDRDYRERFGCPADVMVYARDVRKTYGAVEVLKGVDLEVKNGTVSCILGSSGAGKSTFLRCINHLEAINHGILLVNGNFVGYDLHRDGLHEVDNRVLAKRRADIGMVFQSFNLFSHMTVLENIIEAPIYVGGFSRAAAIDKARALLKRIGLEGKENQYPRQLSGGQQQRVAITRVLAMDPRVILFDEPTSALDPELVGEVLKAIRDLADSGQTMVIVTHEVAFARDVADEIVFMDKGVVAERGPPKEIIANPRSVRTREFLARAR